MTRLLVVSATPSLAMGLAGVGYHTSVLRPAELDRGPIPPADVVVLDQDDADHALELLDRLRAGEVRCPALLLVPAGATAAATAAAAARPSVEVLAKPVTREAFLSAVARTARLRPAPRPQPPALDPAQAPAVPEPSPATPGPAAGTGDVLDLRDGPTAGVDLPDAAPAPDPTPEAVRLVRRLLPLTGDLYGVRETAQAVIEDAVDRLRASAGALLVPDAGTWKVAGAVGLRPLEYRFELPAASWLVQTVAVGRMGLVIDDTDVVRRQLQGAPLASARHCWSRRSARPRRCCCWPAPASHRSPRRTWRPWPRPGARLPTWCRGPSTPAPSRGRSSRCASRSRRSPSRPPAWRRRPDGSRSADRYSTKTRSSTSCSDTTRPSGSNRACSNRFAELQVDPVDPFRFFSIETRVVAEPLALPRRRPGGAGRPRRTCR